MGLGSGSLSIEDGAVEPKVAFTPTIAATGRPALAIDGWVELLPEQPGQGTRTDLRSLDAAEQRRVLQVGACLPCHATARDAIYVDFAASLGRRTRPGSGCDAAPSR